MSLRASSFTRNLAKSRRREPSSASKLKQSSRIDGYISTSSSTLQRCQLPQHFRLLSNDRLVRALVSDARLPAHSNTTCGITNSTQSNASVSINAQNVGAFTDEILLKYDLGSFPPTMINTATRCVQFWASSTSQKGVENGGKIIHRLIDEIEHGSSAEPSCFNLVQVMESFMMSSRRYLKPDRFSSLALDLLNRLDRLNNAVKPTQVMYNISLDALSKSGRRDSISAIENILQRMEKSSDVVPNTSSYNCLLYAHSQHRQNGAPKKCEALLRRMQQNQEHTTAHVDTVSYNIVINCWAKSNDDHAANRAEMLLREMQDNYSSGQLSVKPNLVSFTSVSDAWSRSSSKDVEAAQRAEAILDLLQELSELDEELRPNAFTFHVVMNAWSQSSLPGAATNAERLLDNMIERNRAGDKRLKPGKISFAICIKAWAGSGQIGSSEKALALLKRMQTWSKESEYNIAPDIGMFNSVLRALANDSDVDKATKAEDILLQIESLNLRPDLTTYNNILRCCGTTRSDDDGTKRSAVRIATETLLRIQKAHEIIPDPYTFNFFIKVCDRLTSGNEKLKLIKVAFHYCTKCGQFSAPVLSLMKNALTPNELKNILRIEDNRNLQDLRVADFPKEWSRASDKRDSRRS